MYNVKLNSFSFSNYSNIRINSIDGLCPPGSTITTQKMGRDGTKFLGSTKNERNIVINFSILNNVKETRKILYNELVVGDEVDINIDEYKTTGYIETFEINNFQMTTTGQISIICPSSYFYEDEQVLRVTENGISFNSEMLNDYILEVEIDSDGYNFGYNLNDEWYFISTPLEVGYTLTIDTYNRKIFVGNENRYSDKSWMEWGLIKKGENHIYFEFDGSCTVKLKYKNRYLGI